MRPFNVLVLLMIGASVSCSKKSNPDQNCLKYANANVSRIEKATDGTTTVYFPVNSGCGQFNKFAEKKEGNTRTITVQAVYKGCMCTMDIPERKATYKLNETKPGTYYLKFVSGENAFETDTVVIK